MVIYFTCHHRIGSCKVSQLVSARATSGMPRYRESCLGDGFGNQCKIRLRILCGLPGTHQQRVASRDQVGGSWVINLARRVDLEIFQDPRVFLLINHVTEKPDLAS